ncbi:hypothetical protein TSUD_174940 [Trifolium subterraneum]|uniref:RNase H type-1 domain-containing protein n=1 Tax=Trifolium subterraneum TaxID=3900 RepID=A0A2Z6NXT3_TRISU|nr:hypothetical protein TSUD_174940 [Trifolium subterraneum]
MVFSKKVPTIMRQAIHQILPMATVDNYSKYFGQLTIIGKSKTQVFNFIQDKIWKKLKGWKEKHLSFAGRGALIKAVAQAIPTYLMSNFLIPKGLCNQMESMIDRLWWGSNVDKRKIHWVGWKKTCKQKQSGGMGFRDPRAFNEALLAKQGWRFLTEPDSLMARSLKAKYFPHHNFFQAKKGTRSSYSWQSIHQASWILKKGCFWIMGNGNHINIWEDRWINPQVGNTIWTTKPSNTPLQYMLKNSTKEDMQIIATLTYGLWLARNNKVFQKKDTPTSEAVERTMKNLSEYHHHIVAEHISSSKPPNSIVGNNISWSPPPSNYLKLNVDAHLTNDGRWGFGMLVRRDDGRCVGAATRVCKGNPDADMAEATGLFETIKLIEKNCYSNTIIELDAEKIVLAMNNHQFLRTNWGKMVQRCDRVYATLSHTSVSWTSRKGNEAAHALAR